MRLGEIIDRNGDIHAFDIIVGNADGALKVGRGLTRRGVAGNGLQALGYMLGSTAGVEGKEGLAGFRGITALRGIIDRAPKQIIANSGGVLPSAEGRFVCAALC